MVHFALFLVKISINFRPGYSTLFFPSTVDVSTLQNFQNFSKLKHCIFNESCALHCRYPSALASLHSNKGMVMHYFKWSGVLAIRTMQCIPMLFLYYTLHLYYTGVGLAANTTSTHWSGLSAPLTAISTLLLMSSSSCTAATLTDWIVFSLSAPCHACFLFHFIFEFNLESLSFTWQLVLTHLFM
jgi:hypothetical protein